MWCWLHWRHNERDGASNHQPYECSLNCLFRRRSKKASKLRVTGLCAGNSPVLVNSTHKRPVTRKMFPFDDIIIHLSVVLHRVPKPLFCITSLKIILLKLLPHLPVDIHPILASRIRSASFCVLKLRRCFSSTSHCVPSQHPLAAVWLNAIYRRFPVTGYWHVTFGPIQNGIQFTAPIFKLIFLYKRCYLLIQISLRFFPMVTINQHWIM